MICYLIFSVLIAAAAFTVRRRSLLRLTGAAFYAVQAAFAVRIVAGGLYGETSAVWFAFDAAGTLFYCLLCIVSAFAFFHSKASLHDCDLRQTRTYAGLLMLLTTAIAGAYFASNLAVTWIFLEATTLCSAGIVYHRRTAQALEAAWKYVFVCSTGIAMAYLGILLLAAATDCESLDYATVAAAAPGGSALYLKTAFLLILCGYSCKAELFPLYTVGGILAVLALLGTPWGGKAAREGLQKVGLVNHAGEAPVLIAKRQDTDNPRLTVWEFDPCGIPLGEWEDKRARIETALNITIAKMTWAEGRKIICVYAVPAESDFPALLPWKDKYLSPDSFVLVLGESLTGPVTVNLANIPHILLGGSTGSGKSVLLKLLLMQAVEKGAEVYIADFKGGVDFPRVWRQKCHMCFREDELLHTLDQLTAVLECRKKRLEETECKDLDTYNEATGEGLPRLVFACDEVAEMLDKTGADNERKKLLAQIENKLSTIARQGRAFGIHLILATQRPDATIIPGQIRNNMDFRVCGRADSVLSQIILDNTSAAEQIPKDARGRFITGDGTVFQGYLFDEERF